MERFLRQLAPDAWIAAAGGTIVGVALAGHLFVLKPALDHYGELEQEQLATSAEIDTERGRADPVAVATLTSEVEDLRDRVGGGAGQVPLTQMESYVINALDRVSVRHDVKLESVTPGTVQEVLMFTELPYDVQVTGSYFSLFEWLRDVETELRPMVVKSFEMKKGKSSEQILMSLELVAYRGTEEQT